MSERIASEPWAFWGGFVIWIPLAVWIVKLVHWAVLDEISVIVAFLGVCLAVLLGVLTRNPPDPRLPPIILAVVCLTVLIFPVASLALHRRRLDAIDADIVERAYEVLREKPTNVGSEVRIATILFERGLPGHAIAILESVLRRTPPGIMDAEKRTLNAWRERTPPELLDEPVTCADCGAANRPAGVYCYRCHGPFLLHFLAGGFVAKGLGSLVAAWLGVIALVLALALSAMLLSPAMAAASVAAILALAAAGIALAISRRGAGA